MRTKRRPEKGLHVNAYRLTEHGVRQAPLLSLPIGSNQTTNREVVELAYKAVRAALGVHADFEVVAETEGVDWETEGN
jgi:hypothetical protein